MLAFPMFTAFAMVSLLATSPLSSSMVWLPAGYIPLMLFDGLLESKLSVSTLLPFMSILCLATMAFMNRPFRPAVTLTARLMVVFWTGTTLAPATANMGDSCGFRASVTVLTKDCALMMGALGLAMLILTV